MKFAARAPTTTALALLLFALLSLQPDCAESAALGRSTAAVWRQARQHSGKSGAERTGKIVASEEDTSVPDDDADEARQSDLLAERDDLRAQVATKTHEFMEQHRKADHLLRQLRMQKLRERAERKELDRVRAALARLGQEAAAAAAVVVDTNTTGSSRAAASGPAPRHPEHNRQGQRVFRGQHIFKAQPTPVAVAALEVSEHVSRRAAGQRTSALREGSSKRAAAWLQGTQLRQQASAEQAADLRHQTSSLQEEIEATKKSAGEEQDKVHQQMHEMMLKAASKVHDLEDQADSLGDDLAKEQAAYKSATAEDNNAKDTLMQETQATRNASQHADSLSTSLSAFKTSLEQSSAQAKQLQSTVAALRGETLRSRDAIQEIADAGADQHAAAENAQKSVDDIQAQVRQSEAEIVALRKQVTVLTQKSKQADTLAERLRRLQHETEANSSREEMLQIPEQIERVQELKERDSEEFESARNTSATWQAKANDLEHQVLESEQGETMIARQRDAAQEQVRQARAEANRYFDENSESESRRQALEDKLQQAKVTANRSEANSTALQAEAAKLRDETARAQDTSRDAVQKSEQDLADLKDDVQTANALREQTEEELSRTEAVLSQSQRRMLGLLATSHAQRNTASILQVSPALPQEAPEAAASAGGAAGSSTEGGGVVPARVSLPSQEAPAPMAAAAPQGLARPAAAVAVAAVASPITAKWRAATAVAAVAATAAPQLRGEPPRPKDSDKSAEAILASVGMVVPAAPLVQRTPLVHSSNPSGTGSTLEKLAAYFASPLQH